MKAMILRDDAADAVQTAHVLAAKGFQTLCVGSRDIAQAMIRADVIDLMVMDERIGAQLTHTLALSAERRNPYVCTIIMTDQGAEATDDLYELIPSLYAVVGTQTGADILGKLVLCAVANTDEAEQRVARQAASVARDVVVPDEEQNLLADCDDLAWDDPADDDTADTIFAMPALAELAAADQRSWSQFAGVRPHLAMVGSADPHRGASAKVCA